MSLREIDGPIGEISPAQETILDNLTLLQEWLGNGDLAKPPLDRVGYNIIHTRLLGEYLALLSFFQTYRGERSRRIEIAYNIYSQSGIVSGNIGPTPISLRIDERAGLRISTEALSMASEGRQYSFKRFTYGIDGYRQDPRPRLREWAHITLDRAEVVEFCRVHGIRSPEKLPLMINTRETALRIIEATIPIAQTEAIPSGFKAPSFVAIDQTA